MTIRSGFFNSVNGDRKYDAKRFAEYFATFISNGVFPNPSTNFQVVSNNDMTVTVKAGKAWINGYVCIDDEDYIITIDPADGALNRIDRIVLRWDAVDREMRIEVKKGTFASTPVAPSLQRDADAYELGIADIRINKGAVSITQASITDLRLSNEYCGIVHGLVDQVDTEVLFQDYMSWIDQKKNEFNTDLVDYRTLKQGEIDNIVADFQNDFITWFATIQDILDENAAGNLLSIINQFKDTKGQPHGIANLDSEGKVPVDQLGNIEYFKEWYGRGVVSLSVNKLLDPRFFSTRGFDFLFSSYRKYNPSTITLDANGKSDSIYKFLVTSYFQGANGSGTRINISASTNTQAIMSLVARTGSTQFDESSHIVACSVEKYDLTNIDYIDVECDASGSNNNSVREAYFGITKNNTTDTSANGYDRYVGFTTTRGSAIDFPREVRRIDVRDLTGEHFLKISGSAQLIGVNIEGHSASIVNLYIREVKFIGNSGLQVDSNGLVTLSDGKTIGDFEFDSQNLPAHALDWISLNGLTDTPPTTSVQYDIYDNHNVLLKGDVQTGEVFKDFVNPIIVPKIILNRNSVSDPSPIFERLSLGYRGGAVHHIWQKISEIILDVETQQVDITGLDGYNEIMIKCSNMYTTHTSGGQLCARINNDSGNFYSTNNIYKSGGSTSAGGNDSNGIDTIRFDQTTGQSLPSTPSSNGSFAVIEMLFKNTSNPNENTYGQSKLYSRNNLNRGLFHYNKKDIITSISLYSSISNRPLGVGCKFEVWGR